MRWMRRPLLYFFLISLALAVGGCRRRSDPTAARIPAPAGGAATEIDVDAGLVEDARAYATRTWSFPLDRYDVRIEDAGFTSALDRVLEKTNAELVVNAGFFDRDGKALGLAISNGEKLAPFAKSLSGGVVTYDGDRARLFATEIFELPEGARFAIQCRPRLVVDGAPNVRSDDGKRSERTALCLRDGGRTLDVITVRASGESAGPSLFALGKWLATRGCENALNLDGGPSTGAAWREAGGAVKSEPPRGPVRQAIAIIKR
jgi:hypothetical protein